MKECGADAAKFQWTSDPAAMAARRNDPVVANYEILAYSVDCLEALKRLCDRVGIEFMCTVFLAKDIPTIAPLVKRFKVASAESSDMAFVKAHRLIQPDKQIIVSYGFGSMCPWDDPHSLMKRLHCVVAYPTPIEQANINRIAFPADPDDAFDGLSDHTTSVLTGALAVAAGASCVEKHVKLHDTPHTNPDYPHSLEADCGHYEGVDLLITHPCFSAYVALIREAEKAMGSGANEMMPCEVENQKRRVKA